MDAVYSDASLAKKELGWTAARGLDEMCKYCLLFCFLFVFFNREGLVVTTQTHVLQGLGIQSGFP